MIDIENEVFDTVALCVLAEEPDAYVTGIYERMPAKFPCVMLIEKDNRTNISTQTNASMENHAVLLYELDVYSNLIKNRKAQCKRIAAIVDEQMQRLGFTRNMLEPIDNMLDASIYRIKGRYQAIVDKNKTIYRR